MARLWIGNLAPGTTEAELKAFLAKYGAPEFSAMQDVPGDGSRPAAILSFGDDMPATALEPLVSRLDGMVWKQRSLAVQIIH